jgi:hypothetical protein
MRSYQLVCLLVCLSLDTGTTGETWEGTSNDIGDDAVQSADVILVALSVICLALVLFEVYVQQITSGYPAIFLVTVLFAGCWFITRLSIKKSIVTRLENYRSGFWCDRADPITGEPKK